MIWTMLAQLYSTLLELLRLSRLSTDEKDLEILILRQQLDVMVCKNNQAVRPSREEKWSLAVLAAALKRRGRLTTSQLGSVIRIFKPETVIGWHRELARRKWTQTPVNQGGRPLRRVLSDYVAYYNTRRPHQALHQQSPVPRTPTESVGPVVYRQVLGGIINDYYRTTTGLALQSN